MPNALPPSPPSARRPAAPLPLLAATLALASVGCRTVHVTERQFFDSRPAALPDSLRGRSAYWPAPYALREIAFRDSIGTPLYGVWLRRADRADGAAPAAVVLYFGGSNFQIGQDYARLRPIVRALADSVAREGRDVDLIAVDYPASGRSGGTASIASYHAAALAAYDAALRETGAPAARLVVHGHSLGTMLAMSVADARPVGAVVLEGPATNAREWARSFVPWYARPFVRFDLPASILADDNLARARRMRAPLLVLAGAADRETKPALARRLYREAGASPKHLVELSGVDHMIVLRSPTAAAAEATFVRDAVVRPASGTAGGAP